MSFNVKTFLEDLAAGAVRAFGAPDVKPSIIDSPDGHSSTVLVRDGYKLEVIKGPTTQRRRHGFADVTSFAAWCKREIDRAACASTADILVDIDSMEAVASPTPLDPNGDLARCRLDWHPRAARWFRLFGAPVGQQTFHEFLHGAIEDFPAAKTAKGEDAGSYGEWLAGQVGKLSIAQGQSLKVEIDDRGTTTFLAADSKTEVGGKLPPRFTVRVPGIVGVPGEYTLEVLLRLSVSKDGTPVFRLECPSLPVVQRQAALDAVAHLGALLGEGYLVGVGKAAFVTVPVVR